MHISVNKQRNINEMADHVSESDGRLYSNHRKDNSSFRAAKMATHGVQLLIGVNHSQ